MSEALQDAGQGIAASPTPAEEFQRLARVQQREVFFRLPETVQETLVADMDAEGLRGFVRRLDPDEATDVLGFADEEARETVLRRLDEERREKIAFLLDRKSVV